MAVQHSTKVLQTKAPGETGLRLFFGITSLMLQSHT